MCVLLLQHKLANINKIIKIVKWGTVRCLVRRLRVAAINDVEPYEWANELIQLRADNSCFCGNFIYNIPRSTRMHYRLTATTGRRQHASDISVSLQLPSDCWLAALPLRIIFFFIISWRCVKPYSYSCANGRSVITMTYYDYYYYYFRSYFVS